MDYIDSKFLQGLKPRNLVESHGHFEIDNWLMCHWISKTICYWIRFHSPTDIFIMTLNISKTPRCHVTIEEAIVIFPIPYVQQAIHTLKVTWQCKVE